MFQPRMLARGEAILRDPATGGTNLAAAPDIWHELRPRHEGERFEILAVSLLLGGANLLSRLDALGDSAGTIEFGMFGFDGYGTLRDMAATSPQVLSSADEWNEGKVTGDLAASLPKGNRQSLFRAVLKNKAPLYQTKDPSKRASSIINTICETNRTRRFLDCLMSATYIPMGHRLNYALCLPQTT